MTHAAAMLAGLSGVARYTVALTVIRWKFGRLTELPDDDSWRGIWRFALRIEWLLSGRAMYANRFQIPWPNFLAERLLRQVGGRPGASGDLVRVDRHRVGQLFSGGRPAPLVVSVHSKLTFAIRDALLKAGTRPVMFGSYPARDRLGQDGLDVPNDNGQPVIAMSPGALLEIRKATRAGHPVIAMVDISSRRKGSLFHRCHISAGLFDFAQRNQIPLVFAAATPDQQGMLHVDFATPVSEAGGRSSEDMARQFIAFIGDATGRDAGWEIVASRASVEQPRHKLRDFCICARSPAFRFHSDVADAR